MPPAESGFEQEIASRLGHAPSSAAGMEEEGEGEESAESVRQEFLDKVASIVGIDPVPNPQRVGVILDGSMEGALAIAKALHLTSVPVVVVENAGAQRGGISGLLDPVPVVRDDQEAVRILTSKGVSYVVTYGSDQETSFVVENLQEAGLLSPFLDLAPLVQAGLEEHRYLERFEQYL